MQGKLAKEMTLFLVICIGNIPAINNGYYQSGYHSQSASGISWATVQYRPTEEMFTLFICRCNVIPTFVFLQCYSYLYLPYWARPAEIAESSYEFSFTMRTGTNFFFLEKKRKIRKKKNFCIRPQMQWEKAFGNATEFSRGISFFDVDA